MYAILLATTICKGIKWLIQVSKLEWSIHKEAHDYAKGLISPAGLRPATSLDSVWKAVIKHSQETWTCLFEDSSYKGHNFLHLERPDRNTVKPTYINGGVWLSPVGGNLSVAVRLFRCIFNHAPIGLYYERFNIPEPLTCDCGFHCQDCDYILLSCTKHMRKANWCPHYLKEVMVFLEENSSVFSFRRPLGVSWSTSIGMGSYDPVSWKVQQGCGRTGWNPSGSTQRPSSGCWVRSRLGWASKCLGVVLTLTPALPLMCTRGWPPWTSTNKACIIFDAWVSQSFLTLLWWGFNRLWTLSPSLDTL